MAAEVKSEIPGSPVCNSVMLGTVNGTGAKKLKGVKVSCGELRKYLYAVEIYRQASMLRKGREVHKIYINVHKGVSFLDDRFTLTEFGKMVLENGSVRAGRARNVRQIVVARETLYCSGTGGCKRACGGYGSCISGCDKIKVRGHKCSFRVKLTMRLGFVDHWFVEILGSHNCYIGDGEPPNDMEKMLADYESRSTDEEDTNFSCSQQASPHDEVSPMVPTNQNGASFLTSMSSPASHSSVLLTSAHCPLNVPLFPESYLLTVARNAAAAVAISNGNSQANGQPSLRQDRSPDMLAPKIMSGLLHPSIIPRFGLLPSSLPTSPPTGDNGCSPNMPLSDVMDLSTPKVKKEDGSLAQLNSKPKICGDSAFKHSSSLLTYTHSITHKSSGTTHRNTDRAKSNLGLINQKSLIDNIPNSNNTLPSGSLKNAFISIPVSSQGFSQSPAIVSSPSSPSLPTNPMYFKCGFRTLKPSSVPHPKSALVTNNPLWTKMEESQVEATAEEKKCANQDKGDLDKNLVNRVQQLEAHVTQLRNIVLKNDGTSVEGHGHKKQQRDFDFTKYNTRHIALKIAYLGWDYQGFVVQEDSNKTIESALFEALLKTRLIEARETSNYHRCGRTDKGVSALGQVISIDLRTNLLTGVGVKVREGGTASTRPGDSTTEIRYVHILNKVLPAEIRVLAWAPVDAEFSARFSCKKRTYKYYFPRGNLNIQRMNEATAKLIGEHDFRNLCKMDVGNGVVNFTRKILRADITVLSDVENGYSMCELVVVGQAFLWHQIRCIVAVLFLVAQGKEDVGIIEELLDVDKNPRKPQYPMASELPLVLFDCEFADDLEWIYEADWHEDNIRHLQQMWAQYNIRATMLKRMLEELDVAKVETASDIAPWNELSTPILQQSDWLIPGNKPRVYKPLFKRQMCESLEERMNYYNKKRKLAEQEAATEVSSETS